MAKTKKKNRFFLILILSILSLLVFRIILTHTIGSKGMAYFSVSNELFFLLSISMGFGFEKGVDLLVDGYMQRQQYENAKRVVKGGGLAALILGGLLSFLMLLLSNKISGGLFGMHSASMGLYCMLPTVPLMLLTGVIRGYFSGIGNNFLMNQSNIVSIVSYLIAGYIGSFSLGNYGEKVSLLLKVDDFKYSYAAMGAAIGILISAIITFLHALILYILLKQRSEFSNGRDYTKSIESVVGLGVSVVINSLLPFALFACVIFVPVINEILVLNSDKDTQNALAFTFGEYYGKSFSLAYVFVIIVVLLGYSLLRKSISFSYKEEYRKAREQLTRMIHRCATYAFFIVGMVIVLSENILGALYVDNGASTVSNLQLEAVSVIFAVFALILTEILIQLGYINLTGVISLIASFIHLIISLILVCSLKLSIKGAIVSNIIFFALVAAACFVIVSRIFQYTQEWFRCFAVSFIAAGVSALVGLFINKVLVSKVGNVISLIIVLVICIFVNAIILLALRGYDEEELQDSLPGRMMLALGRMFNLI